MLKLKKIHSSDMIVNVNDKASIYKVKDQSFCTKYSVFYLAILISQTHATR